MIDMSYSITGVDAILAGLGRMQDATEPQRDVLVPLGARYVDVLKDETPMGRGEQPGKLKAGWNDDDQGYTPAGAHVRIRNEVKHLKYVLAGRGPVVAKRAKVLRFVIDGQVFYRRRVKATKANNFIPRATAKMQSALDAAPERIAEKIVKRYGG